ncbi:MAG TPA: HAD family hydrolase [Prolixibacteraceae bacterium]|nr:HAD family hydrolase [Prolixibacteraceae bacterium]
MHNINTIIWDWNGTLLNDVDVSIETINELLNERELPLLTKNSYREVFGFPVEEYYRRIGFDFQHEPFEVPAHQYIERYKQNHSRATLQTSAIELLDFFRKKGFTQIVLSASESTILYKQLQHHNITHYFDKIAGLSHIYATSKAELGIQTLHSLNISSENACMIGDTTHDYEVAQKIGCSCILVNGGHHAENKLLETGATVVKEMKDLSALFL